MEEQQGGTIANISGKTLEGIVRGALVAVGLEPVPYRAWEKSPELFDSELLLQNVPYDTIYGHRGSTEFLAQSKKYHINTRIECKWQQSSGSVDEKFPYLFLNCINQMQEPHVIILCDGGGAKKGALDWLSHACQTFSLEDKSKSGRVIELMSTTEFISWVNRSFR